jgi:hypothetical protein
MSMNVSHSPLVQESARVIIPQQDHAVERELLDARRKFSSNLESNVLDYLHYGPQALEDCVKTMLTLFSNILEHPDDPKYRKVTVGYPCKPRQQLCCPVYVPQTYIPYRAPLLAVVLTTSDMLYEYDHVQIKAVNKAYLKHIAGVNHAEGLMIQAGWRSKVCLQEHPAITVSCQHTQATYSSTRSTTAAHAVPYSRRCHPLVPLYKVYL